MQKLDEKTIVRIIREEWESRKASVLAESKSEFQTASPGLKLKSKEGLLYTVTKVAPGVVTIADPMGAETIVSNADLEKGFEIA